MAAQRSEPAPAMGYFNHVSFGDSVWALADDDDMEELPSTIKLAYASNEASFSNAGASMADVTRVLYDCKPVLPASILMIRQEAWLDGAGRTRLRSGGTGDMIGTGHSNTEVEGKNQRLESIRTDLKAIVDELRDHMSGRPLPRVKNTKYKDRRLPVRHLRVNDSGINAQELDDISALLCGHATLSTLALQSSELLPRPSGLFARLAAAISLSNLRIIELSNNPIGPRSMCELLDHLCAPNLTHLYLSMTMQRGLLFADTQMNPLWREGGDIAAWQDKMQSDAGKKVLWDEEMAKVTDRLERLIRLRDGHTQMQAPYAPHLSLLSLNGNDLRWRNVQRLVRAILFHNASLTHVELFATCDNDDSDDEEDGSARESAATGSRAVRRVTSIGTAMMTHQRQSRGASTNNGHNGSITPPRAAAPLLVSQAPEANSHPRGLRARPVQKSDWRRVLGSHLWNNRFNTLEAKIAARHLLGPARVLTCKCRTEEQSLARRLPPEVWRRIVSHLDADDKLSLQQIERIISFASDPTTIGYGRRSTGLGMSEDALHALKQEIAAHAQPNEAVGDAFGDYGLVPHRRWRWSGMIARHSVPRDWPAQIIDEVGKDNGDALLVEEAGLVASPSASGQGPIMRMGQSNTRSHHEHDTGGGGGPDGEGGATLSIKGLPSRGRRVWLDEQSALQAFYEATGTYCAQ